MDDGDLVVAVAAEMVRRHGKETLSHLRDHAEIAAGLRDDLSLKAWTDIAGAVAMLMGRDRIVTLRPRQDRGRGPRRAGLKARQMSSRSR